jgi:hypothetical protein
MRARGLRIFLGIGVLSALVSAACSGDDAPPPAAASTGGAETGTGGLPKGGSGGSKSGGAGGTAASESGGSSGSGTDASALDASPPDASGDGSNVLSGDTVGPQGGTLIFENGNVTFAFPPGAVAKDVKITVAAATPEPTRWPAIPGTEFDFGPEGTTFAKPVRVTIRYATLPDHVDPAMLAIAKGVGAQWQPVHSASNATAKTVTGDLTGFSPHGVVNLGFATIERNCGLTGIGEVWCWGDMWSVDTTKFLEPTKVSDNITFSGYDSFADHRKLSASRGMACGVSTIGELWCAGGDGASSFFPSGLPPVAEAPGYTFDEVSIWGSEICAITTPRVDDGGDPTSEAYCWGDNTRGQLGVGTPTAQTSRSTTPLKVQGNLDFLHIAAGGQFACGITKDGFTYCWGDETYGQVGRGRGDYAGIPTQLFITLPGQSAMPLTLVSISAGATHACGIDSAGRAICWGDNFNGQIGDGTAGTGITTDPNQVKLPTAVPGYSWFRLEAGGSHTCGVTSAARTYCWGQSVYVGDGRTTPVPSTDQKQTTPVEVVDQSFFTLAAGPEWTCGMTTSGAAYCWGDNAYGELGIGMATPGTARYHTRPEKLKTTVLVP